MRIGIWKTRNWFRYETFIYLFEFKVFQHEERETQFLTMPTVCTSSALNSLTKTMCGHPIDPNWSALAQIKNWLPSSSIESQTNCLFSNHQILSPSLPGMTSFTSPVPFLIWVFYCDICDCYILPACAWTPALNVRT